MRLFWIVHCIQKPFVESSLYAWHKQSRTALAAVKISE